MKVLLTGASGFLGRYVLDCLRQQSIETVVLGLRRVPNSDFSEFIQADLLDSPDFPVLVRRASATHLLHLAWYAEHGKFWSSPLNLRWVEATTRLVEAFCLSGGQKVVIAGTCAEYDWSFGYCREDSTPLNPATLYGTAKDATRRLSMAVCSQHQVPCAWGRVFLPFGSGEFSQRLIPSLIEVFKGKRPPFAINTTAYRDFLHASDVADGFVSLLRNGAGDAYNICSGQPMQLSELVRKLAELMRADPQEILNMSTERLGEPRLLVGENLKLKNLDWNPTISLAQGLKEVISNSYFSLQ